MVFISLELMKIPGNQRIKRIQALKDNDTEIRTYFDIGLSNFKGETIVVYDAVTALCALKTANVYVGAFEDVKLMAKLMDVPIEDRLFTPADRHYYPHSCKHGYDVAFGINLYRLRNLYHQLEACLATSSYKREKAAIPAIVDMQLAGIAFDYPGWHQNLASKWAELKEIQEQRKSNSSCADWKMKQEKLSQYLHTYDTAVKQSLCEGRLYSCWDSFASKSGRMTVRKPNVQAMPKNSRPYFGSKEGKLLVFADFSQIELRVLAEFTKDPALMEIFRLQKDVHTQTAVKLFQKPGETVSAQERKIAKTLNFGIVYGITAYGIQNNLRKQQIPCTPEQAEQFRQDFFEMYPGIRWFQQLMTCATKVRSLGGRLFDVCDCKATQRMNLPIQASAAEGLKETLAIIYRKLKQEWHLVAVVHDELVLEVPFKDAEAAKAVLISAMIEGMEQILKNVPIVVEAAISTTWSTNTKAINAKEITNRKEVRNEIY